MWAAPGETREQITELHRLSAAHSDATIDELALDAPGVVPWWPDERKHVTLQQILVHMCVETAHHLGHADILRELIDGRRGPAAGGPEPFAAHRRGVGGAPGPHRGGRRRCRSRGGRPIDGGEYRPLVDSQWQPTASGGHCRPLCRRRPHGADDHGAGRGQLTVRRVRAAACPSRGLQQLVRGGIRQAIEIAVQDDRGTRIRRGRPAGTASWTSAASGRRCRRKFAPRTAPPSSATAAAASRSRGPRTPCRQ